jgi:hypothetical protein
MTSLGHEELSSYILIKEKYSNTFIPRQFIWKAGDLIKGRTHYPIV